jgi:hypothetical protein
MDYMAYYFLFIFLVFSELTYPIQLSEQTVQKLLSIGKTIASKHKKVPFKCNKEKCTTKEGSTTTAIT